MIVSQIPVMLMFVAFLVTLLIYPTVLRFAISHNVMDNPNFRKLQRSPVPVMGGATIILGISLSLVLGYFLTGDDNFLKILPLLFIVFSVGLWDDIKDISPVTRFLVEIAVIWTMFFLFEVKIYNFHGFLGITYIKAGLSLPLSIVAGVGIINALNMIDGIDGYCSIFAAVSCFFFACLFKGICHSEYTMALIAIGGLIPFILHNVFGRTSKMFLGDGGSLIIGTLLSLFVFRALSTPALCAKFCDSGLSLTAVVLAILAVPIFDTLRVMSFRMIKGLSPFHPDKTHLHHLFLDLQFSHIATTGLIVAYNILIVGALILAWKLGLSGTLQVFLVIALALGLSLCFYVFMRIQGRKNGGKGSAFYAKFCREGHKIHISDTRPWLAITRIVDSRFLGRR